MLDACDSPSTPATAVLPTAATAVPVPVTASGPRPPAPPLPRRRELRQQSVARRRSRRPRHRVEPPRRPPGQTAIRVGAPMTAAGLVASSLLAPSAAAALGSSVTAARAGATPGASSVTATAIGYAMAMLGKPYLWGGSDPAAGFDCSGLVLSAYRYAGLALPRTAAQQYLSATGSRLPLAQAQPGDLVFWGTDPRSGGSVYHVAMYASPGMVISAPSTGSVVQIQRMWKNQLMPLVVRPAPDAAGLLPVRPGTSGWSVSDLQHRLRNNGYAVRVTGTFDQQTLAAVQQLQAALGVVRDPVSPSASPPAPNPPAPNPPAPNPPAPNPPAPNPPAPAPATVAPPAPGVAPVTGSKPTAAAPAASLAPAAPSTTAAPPTTGVPAAPPAPSGAVAPVASSAVTLQAVAGVTVIAIEGAAPDPATAPARPAVTSTAPAKPQLPPLSSAAAPRNPGNPDAEPAAPIAAPVAAPVAPPAAPVAAPVAAPSTAVPPAPTKPTGTAVPGEVGPQTWQWLVSHGNKTSVS